MDVGGWMVAWVERERVRVGRWTVCEAVECVDGCMSRYTDGWIDM